MHVWALGYDDSWYVSFVTFFRKYKRYKRNGRYETRIDAGRRFLVVDRWTIYHSCWPFTSKTDADHQNQRVKLTSNFTPSIPTVDTAVTNSIKRDCAAICYREGWDDINGNKKMQPTNILLA